MALVPLVAACLVLGAVAPSSSEGIFRGIAVDRETRQPIAKARVSIRTPRGHEAICKTDSQGRFETQATYPAGKLFVRSCDNSMDGGRWYDGMAILEWDPASAADPIVVPLPVGQRCELEFDRSSGDLLKTYRVEVRPAGACSGDSKRPLLKASINSGPHPWIRFPFTSPPEAGLELYLLSKDNSRVWHATLPERLDRVLSLEPLTTATLVGRLELPLGSHLERMSPEERWAITRNPVALEFERVAEAGRPARRFTHLAPVSREYRIHGIPGGLWKIRTRTALFEPTETEFAIPEDGLAVLDLRLGKRVPLGTLVIRLIDERGDEPEVKGGARQPDYSAWVRGVDSGPHYQVVVSAMCGVGIDAYFERVPFEGRWIREARIEGVPEGDYEVRVSSSERYFHSTTSTVAYNDVAEFRIRGTPDHGAYGIRPVPVEPPAWEWHELLPISREQDFPLTRRATVGGFHAYELPTLRDLDWCLISWGHQRVYGDRSSFLPEDGNYWAEVTLVPGYSIRVVATLEDGSPARRVHLQFMDETFVTDTAGVALLQCEAPHPLRRVQVTTHRIVGGDADVDGHFPQGLPDLRLTLKAE